MIGQLRTYTVNRGMMDSWLDLFEKECAPNLEEAGISVHSAWVTEDRSQFVWVRCFPSRSEIELREAAFYGSDWYKARMEHIRSHIARMEIQLVELAA